MTQAPLYKTLMEGHFLPDTWWAEGVCPDLTWRYRVRHWTRSQRRELARQYAPEARNRWEAQLLGYQTMPNEDLLDFKWVTMRINIAALIGQAGARVNCETCGEEILNQREVLWESKILCRACAGQAYYVELERAATFRLPRETR